MIDKFNTNKSTSTKWDEIHFEQHNCLNWNDLSLISDDCYKNYLNLSIDHIQTGRYQNEFNEIELIGFGGFGSVFKAFNKLDNNHYAIKKLRNQNENNCHRILKELKILAKLSNVYVVQYYGSWIELNESQHSNSSATSKQNIDECGSYGSQHNFGLNKGVVYIQMELCGLTLKEVINKIKCELNRIDSKIIKTIAYFIASELFIQILECVHYLHSRDEPIIHRDLKPSNILITDGSNGRFVKIADFGLATKHLFCEQSHTTALGTQQYMAPEVKLSRKYDTKADMYSLGIIMKDLFNLDSEDYHDKFKYKSTIFSALMKTKYITNRIMYSNLISSDPNLRPTFEYLIDNKILWSLSLGEMLNSESSFGLYEQYFNCAQDNDDLFCPMFARQLINNKNINHNENKIKLNDERNLSFNKQKKADLSNYLLSVLEIIKTEESDRLCEEFTRGKFEEVIKDDKYSHNITILIEKVTKLDGIANMDIKNFSCILDLDEKSCEITGELFLSDLIFKGNYKIDGKVFRYFPVIGNGEITINAKNLVGTVKIKASIKDNKYKTDFVDIRLSLSSIKLHLENLFDANMTPVLNSLLNAIALPLFNKHFLENKAKIKELNERSKKSIDGKLKDIYIDQFMKMLD